MRFVLDTTAFSAAMRGDPALMKLFKRHRPGDIVTVPPVVAEIQYGLERQDKASKKFNLLKAQRDRWLSVVRVLAWSNEASERFGEIKADLERLGQMIDDFDIAIAAIAMAHQCSVLTANLEHFQRIKQLESRSWVEASR